MSPQVRETINGDRIELRFPYNETLIDMARALPDRVYDDKPNRHWHVPATPFHAEVVRKVFEDLLVSDPMVDDLVRFHEKPPPKMNLPKGLYPFQRVGAQFIERTGGRTLVADDMGCGKTMTTLGWINHNQSNLKTSLIIVPTTGLFKWQTDIGDWLGAESIVVDTGKVQIEPADFLIMSYAMMRIRESELADLDLNLIVFDESTRLINAKTQQAKAGRNLARMTEHVLLLSGTPFLNRHIELFNPMHIMNPKAYPNWYYYAIRYTNGKNYGWTGLRFKEELERRLSFDMIRRTKREVLKDLPDLQKVFLPITLEDKDMKPYLEALDKMLDSPNPIEHISHVRHVLGRSKRRVTVQWAKNFLNDSDEKLVIYCRHLDVMDYLVHELEAFGSTFINGNVSAKEREKRKNKFQTSQYPRVIVINSAATEIIDLHTSSNILFAEREWVPAIEKQAWSRLDRLGQKNAVTAWFLLAVGTMDENLEAVVNTKAKKFGDLMGDDAIESSVMTGILEELRRKR